MKKATLAFFIFLGIEIIVGGVVLMFDKSNVELSTALSSLSVLLVFYLMKLFNFSCNYIKTRPYATLGLCCLLALSTLFPSMKLIECGPEMPADQLEMLEKLMQSFVGFLFVGILAPVVEELVFRGVILKHLLLTRKFANGHWLAIAITAALFGLAHGNLAQMPHAFLLGLLLGWLYYRTGSILPSIALHLTNNVTAVVLYQIYPDPDAKLIDYFGSDWVVYAVIAASLIIMVGTVYALTRRM
ncbi:MAG: CPBP family intramembrane metalloprotease [Bacteroidaceae bacterium]|nr:CPBP family intramembrane metalloprotease [Bacteroidaceae bacterium]